MDTLLESVRQLQVSKDEREMALTREAQRLEEKLQDAQRNQSQLEQQHQQAQVGHIPMHVLGNVAMHVPTSMLTAKDNSAVDKTSQGQPYVNTWLSRLIFIAGLQLANQYRFVHCVASVCMQESHALSLPCKAR